MRWVGLFSIKPATTVFKHGGLKISSKLSDQYLKNLPYELVASCYDLYDLR